jgi:hypothetical protein
MLVGGVRQHLVENDLEAARVGGVEQGLDVVHGPVVRLHA